jgi:hypothetical protein
MEQNARNYRRRRIVTDTTVKLGQAPVEFWFRSCSDTLAVSTKRLRYYESVCVRSTRGHSGASDTMVGAARARSCARRSRWRSHSRASARRLAASR